MQFNCVFVYKSQFTKVSSYKNVCDSHCKTSVILQKYNISQNTSVHFIVSVKNVY